LQYPESELVLIRDANAYGPSEFARTVGAAPLRLLAQLCTVIRLLARKLCLREAVCSAVLGGLGAFEFILGRPSQSALLQLRPLPRRWFRAGETFRGASWQELNLIR
jgi:hypothetical protein